MEFLRKLRREDPTTYQALVDFFDGLDKETIQKYDAANTTDSWREARGARQFFLSMKLRLFRDDERKR